MEKHTQKNAQDNEGVRIDKWLWAVRIYRTRSKATQACKSGKIKIPDQKAKPAHLLHPGDILTIEKENETRKIKVLKLLEKRIGAKLVPEYMETLYLEKPRQEELAQQIRNADGRPTKIRPTKKDRREILKFLQPDENE